MGVKKYPHIKKALELKELRGNKKKTEFSKALKISYNTYLRYETGERDMPDGLMELARRVAIESGDLSGHSTPMVEETAAAYRQGLEIEGKPLTPREINELKMLRWLEEKHPERRQRISDQLTEIFIAAKAES